MRVLVVEDDPTNQFIVNKLFDSVFEISNARTSNEAMELFEDNDYEVVIIDIKLGPDSLGGEALLNELRKYPKSEKSKFVGVSSYSTLEESGIFENAGFDLFLSKPYSKQNMYKAITELVN